MNTMPSTRTAAFRQGKAERMIPMHLVSGLAAISDMFTIVVASFFSYFFHSEDEYLRSLLSGTHREMYAAAALSGAVIAALTFRLIGLYTIPRLCVFRRQSLGVTLGWSAALAALVAFATSLHVAGQFPPAWVATWYVSALTALLGGRWVLSRRVRQWQTDGRLSRNVVVVGAGAPVTRLLKELDHTDPAALRIAGVFTVGAEPARDSIRDSILDYPVLGDVASLDNYVRLYPVDDVVVALPWHDDSARMAAIVEQVRRLPVDVRLVVGDLGFRPGKVGASTVGGIALLEVAYRPLKDWHAVVKRVEDLALAGVALGVAAPVMALAALAIRLDSPGPVFFRQKRFGFNNSVIEVWKFRTMYCDRGDPSGAQRTTRNDARVTPVGRFLRRTSLDELPQLFNVITGEMSLVGPRAHAIAMKAGDQLYYDAIHDYVARHRVRPGITGWAQVNGLRGEIETLDQARRRLEYDLYYIDHWSIGLDLRILFKTIAVLWGDKNAY